MQHFPDSVTLAPAVQTVAERLVAEDGDFAHLLEAGPRIGYLFSARALFVHGGRAAAFVTQPRWQGPLAHIVEALFGWLLEPMLGADDADFLIVVDQAIWSGLDVERQEHLVFHELLHITTQEDEWGSVRRSKQTGKPLLKLRPHETETFHAEIEKYGPDVVGLERHCQAIVEGAALAKRRKLKIA